MNVFRVAGPPAIMAVVIGGVVTTPGAIAAANAAPSYEIKLNLTASSLAAGAPSAAVRSAFGLGASSAARSYEYLDTNARDLDGQGWNVRWRNKDGDPLELDYKKRFTVNGGDIDAALTTANQQGFSADDTNYDAEVDWGYAKQTLSFSIDKDPGINVDGTGMPSATQANSVAVRKIPGKLADWQTKGWGTNTLKASRVYGPVSSNVWSGTYSGAKTELEVLPVKAASGSGTETVIELSMKAADYSTAERLRSSAIAAADANGWLLKSDVLKTNLILSRY